VLGKILTEKPRDPSKVRAVVPRHVEGAVLKALEKLPADRFTSAAGFVKALQDPSFRWGEAAAKSTAEGRGGRGWRMAALALAAVAAVLAGLLFFAPDEEPEVTRQRIVLFEGFTANPGAMRYGLALAPDGSAMVYGHPEAGLFLKEGSEANGTLLSGTAGGGSPTFSPDGQWIAFFHEDYGFRKIPRRGGSPMTLVDSLPTNNPSIAWLDDGTIVFNTPGWGMGRVSEAGGPVELLLPPENPEGDVVQVQGLPGARGVVYTTCHASCAQVEIRAYDLVADTASLLLEGAFGPWYVPQVGQLIYAREDGGIYAAPFSLDDLAITGPSIPVLEGVLNNGWFPALQLGADGTLIYLAGETAGAAGDQQLAWVDRDGGTTPIDPDWWGSFGSVALSPDGTMLAVTDLSEQRSVWVKELPAGPLNRLTPNGPNNRRPAWTPDSRYVAFQTGDTAQIFGIRRYDASTEARTFINLAPVHQVSFSRDGRYVVYRLGSVPDGDLRYMEIQGSDTTHYDFFAREGTDEKAPALSPDGHWVAYVSDESGTPEVYVRPFPDAMTSRVTVSDGGGWEPLWARDGSELYYRDGEGMQVAATVELGPTFRVTDRQQLFRRTGAAFANNADDRRYDVADDGRFVMITYRATSNQEPEDQPDLILVENWVTELRRLVEGR
jgi:serine/threonine-protein kinase